MHAEHATPVNSGRPCTACDGRPFPCFPHAMPLAHANAVHPPQMFADIRQFMELKCAFMSLNQGGPFAAGGNSDSK